MKKHIKCLFNMWITTMVILVFSSTAFAQKVVKPTLNPGGATFTSSVAVTIATTTAGATIRYTLNGTNPTATNGTLYSGPVTLTATTTLKAIGYLSGWTNSDVASATYTIAVAAPGFSPAAGQYLDFQDITISSTTSGATIRYTTNGTNPTSTSGTIYTAPVRISQSLTLKAIAYKTGLNNSSVISGAYTIKVSDPVFSPTAGAYPNTFSLNLTTSTSGATIRYTTNGSTPTTTSGTVFSSPLTISTATTVKAIAYKTGLTSSNVVSASYSFQCATPAISPAPGIYNTPQSVTLSSLTTGSSIRYTIDGSTPTSSAGILYSSAIMVNTGTTIKAIAYKSGILDSGVASATYMLKCANPVFSPGSGNFDRPQSVTLTYSTPGSQIRYTTNGTTPTESTGTLFSNPIQVNTSLTIKAIAFKTGFTNSDISSGIYSLGNEDIDGDGVIDAEDDYPQDPLRAMNNFFPASGKGTLAFEDLWPSKGDYDLNDLVVDYSFKTITNSSNKLVETYATFVLRACGAVLENGFGFQLASNNIPASAIKATGMKLTNNYITLSAGGTESGQAIPTFIIFDNAFDHFGDPGSGSGINTSPGAKYMDPVTFELHIIYTANT